MSERSEKTPPADEGPVERPVGRQGPGRADLSMLTMAADAIGLQWEWHQGCSDALHLTAPDAASIFWNPLRSDADALALAVMMEMDVFVRSGRWTEAVRPMGPACKEAHNGDPLAATRRAIVRAAVEDRVTHNAKLTGAKRPALALRDAPDDSRAVERPSRTTG